MKTMIGVDIGTTSTKAVLFDEQGKVLADSNVGYPLYQDASGMAEQDLDEIFDAVCQAIQKVVQEQPETVQGVSFSAAMHSLILLDEKKEPLTRSITWADNRATQYSEQLKQSPQGQQVYERTGTPIHPMSPFVKLMWLQAEHPALMGQARYFIGIKEYVCYRFFGELKSDYSIASATGLFNIHTFDWDTYALELAGIREEQLPDLVPVTYQFHGLQPTYAQRLGLSTEVPFVIGASDGVLSNLGLNAVQEGVLALTIGTSGAIRTVVDHPVTDSQGRLFCYVLSEDKYVVGGPVNSGGVVLNWLQDQFFADEKQQAQRQGIDSYAQLMTWAEEIPAGAAGLLFLPYLGGERAPLWDANARGTFFGLNHTHTKKHLLRAGLEGIIFNLYVVLEALQEITGSPQTIQATGGFARSALWSQLLADVFDKEVIIPESFESSCLGAAVIGMQTLGWVEDVTVVSEMVGSTRTYQPNAAHHEIYQELLPIFTHLASKLTTDYQLIADFQKKLK